MDNVKKSALCDDYMELVSEEATLKMVAEIIQRRKKKISEIVLNEREQPQHRFPFDKELDVLEADLKDVEAEIAAIAKSKEEVKSFLILQREIQRDHLEVRSWVKIAGHR